MAELDATNAQSEDDFGGTAPQRLVPAIYHVMVNHAEEKGSKVKGTPGIQMEFQALAEGIAGYEKVMAKRGDRTVMVGLKGGVATSGQTGATIPMFATLLGKDAAATEYCQMNCTRLALCAGIIRPGERKEPDWSEAIGREMIIEVKASEYTGTDGSKRQGSEVEFLSFWMLNNPAVASVPRDNDSPGMRALAKAGGGNGAKAPVQTASAATAAASRGKYSDL